jgi:copper chaperone CopZ
MFKPRKSMQFPQFQLISQENHMQTVTFSIPNISCNHCVHTIKTEVSDLEGVKVVDANPQTKQAIVSFESPATEEKIVALLKEINYPPVQA